MIKVNLLSAGKKCNFGLGHLC